MVDMTGREVRDAQRAGKATAMLALREEEAAGIGDTGSGMAVLAGRHARQGGEVPPAERGRVAANSSVTVR